MFLVDEESGALNAYDWEVDRWRTVVEAERLKGTLQMAAGGDRCVCHGQRRQEGGGHGREAYGEEGLHVHDGVAHVGGGGPGRAAGGVPARAAQDDSARVGFHQSLLPSRHAVVQKTTRLLINLLPTPVPLGVYQNFMFSFGFFLYFLVL